MPAPDLPRSLHTHRVFAHLDEAARTELATHFDLQPYEALAEIAVGAGLQERLGWVLQGAVSLQHAGGVTVTLPAGELFGAGVGPYDTPGAWRAAAAAATQVAWLPAAEVARLCAEHPALGVYLLPPGATPSGAHPAADPHLNLMTTPVRTLIKRPPVTLPPSATILHTAQTMRAQRVSSVLLIEQDHLFGVVTDRDLRNRALAAGVDPSSPVHEIATAAPLTVDISAPAFEAQLLMARHNIHHVPVLDGQRVAGMITATDLTEQHSTSAVYLAGDIHKQTGVDGLVAAAARVKSLQRNLAAADASAYTTGHIVTAITDAITSRLLVLGEAEFGPAPVDYVWVAAGSQARCEQTAKSDQDNCLLLSDDYRPEAHGAYFEALSRFVTDGLNACGYVYCPGEMMASTAKWRQPLATWIEYFRRWTEKPEPKALMLTCVFFDLRAIHGRASLLETLRREMLGITKANRIFLAHMVGNALTHRPPLTLFGGLATVKHGAVRDAIDLKHSGIVPIVDLARIYALAGGHEAVNTHDRLLVAAQSKEISDRSAHDLRDALEFMATLRIRHQASQVSRGAAIDNFLSLAELSNFERGQLKDAFGVVQTLQSVLAQRYR